MIGNRRQHTLTFTLATLVAAAVFAVPAFGGGAHSTRPGGGSSGGTVSHGGGSPSSGGSHSGGGSYSSGASHSSGGGSGHGNDRAPVSGNATWHQGDHGHYGHGGYYGGGYYGHGAYWNGWYGGWYGSWYWPYYSPWAGWWAGWGPYAGVYYDSGPYVGTQVYPNDNYGAYGALDCDVSPERAEVYVNGQRVGTADDYDGYPTYLWLEQGVYDVVFYMPGFQTIARQYVIRPGLVISVEDSMVPGDAVRPEDLPAKSHENRDARLRQNREVEDDAARGMSPGMSSSAEPWRDRVHPLDRMPADSAQSGEAVRHATSEDARLAPARLRLTVEPGDASVYLDGRFIGTGGEIAQLANGLLIDAGPHRVEAVRPGRKPVAKDVNVEPGGEASVDLMLER